MDTTLTDTADKLVEEAAQLIMRVGYNGFSYADLSARFGIRKASIHYHFPSKVDLAVAVVERARTRIRTEFASLAEGDPVGLDGLRFYTGYWEQCIRDQSAPFCLAAVLAAELPGLPEELAASVRGHFVDLGQWLERLLQLGEEQGAVRLDTSPRVEAQAFMATVYGAMLAARAFDDPDRYSAIGENRCRRIRA